MKKTKESQAENKIIPIDPKLMHRLVEAIYAKKDSEFRKILNQLLGVDPDRKAVMTKLDTCYSLSGGLASNSRNIRVTTLVGHACAIDRIDYVKKLLAEGASPNSPGSELDSPLLIAIANNNLAIVKLLLSQGACPKVLDKEGKNLLYHAVIAAQSHPTSNTNSIVSVLLDQGVDPNEVYDGMSSLFFAISTDLPHSLTEKSRAHFDNKVTLVELLLRHSKNAADPNFTDKTGISPLIYAVQTSTLENRNDVRVKIVRLLLETKKIEVNRSFSVDGFSALHFAVINRNLFVCQLLLMHGAEVNHEAANGDTPLALLLKAPEAKDENENNVRKHLFSLLLKQAADLFHYNKDTVSPLHYCISFTESFLPHIIDLLSQAALLHILTLAIKLTNVGELTISEAMLISVLKRIDIQQLTPYEKSTLLFYSFHFPKGYDQEYFDLLIEAEVDIQFAPTVEQLVDSNALKTTSFDLFKLLRHRHRPQLEHVNKTKIKYRTSLLNSAIKSNKPKLLARLLNLGVDTRIGFGTQTPLHAAVKTRNPLNVELLLNYPVALNEIGPRFDNDHYSQEVTPLVLAITINEFSIARLVLDKLNKDQVNINTSIGTALSMAITQGDTDLVNELIDKGANLFAELSIENLILYPQSLLFAFFYESAKHHKIKLCPLSLCFFNPAMLTVILAKMKRELPTQKNSILSEQNPFLPCLLMLNQLFFFALLSPTSLQGQLELLTRFRQEMLDITEIDFLRLQARPWLELYKLSLMYLNLKETFLDKAKQKTKKIRALVRDVNPVSHFSEECLKEKEGLDEGLIWYLNCLSQFNSEKTDLFIMKEAIDICFLANLTKNDKLTRYIQQQFEIKMIEQSPWGGLNETEMTMSFNNPSPESHPISGRKFLQSRGYDKEGIKRLGEKTEVKADGPILDRTHGFFPQLLINTSPTSWFDGALTLVDVKPVGSTNQSLYLWLPPGLFDEEVFQCFDELRPTKKTIKVLKGEHLKGVERTFMIHSKRYLVSLVREYRDCPRSEKRLLLYQHQNLLIALDYLPYAFHKESEIRNFLKALKKEITFDMGLAKKQYPKG
jgi:ankyrin repeat protein